MGLIAEVMGKQVGRLRRPGRQPAPLLRRRLQQRHSGRNRPGRGRDGAGAEAPRHGDGSPSSFIGDGTLGEGAVYEALNIASKWDLPLLVVLENNRYAQSTPQSQTLAGDIEARAAAFGIETAQADTWDLAGCCRRPRGASRRSERRGPAAVPPDRHLPADGPLQGGRRPRPRRGPVVLGPRPADASSPERNPRPPRRLEAEAQAQIDAAVALAEASPYRRCRPARAGPSPPGSPSWQPTRIDTPERVVNLIHDALRRNMARDDRIVLHRRGHRGALRRRLQGDQEPQPEFPGRVRNTPISESAIVGLGNGLALSGLVPVCEIMFGDFLTSRPTR